MGELYSAPAPRQGRAAGAGDHARQRPDHGMSVAEHIQAAREKLLHASREEWADGILAELGRAHADLRRLTRRLDVFRHGHAMIRPVPGVIGAPGRTALVQGWGRVQFAHADMSGLSLFEEANYHGVRAAEATLRQMGVRHSSSLS